MEVLREMLEIASWRREASVAYGCVVQSGVVVLGGPSVTGGTGTRGRLASHV
jgi:hypothetical protein